ncbi:hypothetical protein BASA50_009599 [Batrachochytrium salamandrivorans]|uniref:PB1 domain-containing protein n=1 Tax=Batrachochytrium salamandrivorans TaxID=1357716 RepID=A0ABQ8F413_9FUNG|nr:hypothetical protein BASA60_009145 [Batrachochytrium salamandrivorans]KAH6568882.1 hypothetical protein BASA62_005250 [Batrachochytrium salamandrivorans]KAH6590185.1 hypothetical protein BASA50_009599 [Batrachochytrium salamandrivorans]KAH6598979.1 hypothetical protein BASA61_002741 [Batrachochytrium salamandrivorans]KAJ1341486.1 hypothetical protein BSLG_003914 [Batrachochytrium salamandrivorans]
MSTKEELQLWIEGAAAYRKGDLEGALTHFEPILSLSKVAFNAGMIYSHFNDHVSADNMYSAALASDPFLAVAFLQKAYAYFMLEDYSRAERCYNKLFELLLDNDYIDYAQLGLKYRLYRCEVHFNKAMCAYMVGDDARGVQGVAAAQKCARSQDHQAIIATAARSGVSDITLFTVPYEAIFEVSESKRKNLVRRSFLKDAKVVVSSGDDSSYVGFTGAAIIDPSLGDYSTDPSKDGGGGSNGTLTIRRRPELAGISTSIPRSPTDRSPVATPSSRTQNQRSRSSSLPSRDNISYSNQTIPRTGDYRPAIPHEVPNLSIAMGDSQTRLLSADPIMENNIAYASRSSSASALRQTRNPLQSLPRSNTDPIQLASGGVQQNTYRRPSFPGQEFPTLPGRNQTGVSLTRPTKSNEGDPNMAKVKIHLEGRTFLLSIPRDIDISTFCDIICSKQGTSSVPNIYYPDEDDPNTMISILDDDDLSLAMLSTKGNTLHFYCREQSDLLDFY